jgi:hypothetical protein
MSSRAASGAATIMAGGSRAFSRSAPKGAEIDVCQHEAARASDALESATSASLDAPSQRAIRCSGHAAQDTLLKTLARSDPREPAPDA